MVCIQLCTIFDGGLKLKNDVIYEAIIEKGYCLLSFFFMKKALHINLLYHMECTILSAPIFHARRQSPQNTTKKIWTAAEPNQCSSNTISLSFFPILFTLGNVELWKVFFSPSASSSLSWQQEGGRAITATIVLQ